MSNKSELEKWIEQDPCYRCDYHMKLEAGALWLLRKAEEWSKENEWHDMSLLNYLRELCGK